MIWLVLVLAVLAGIALVWWLRRPRSPIGEILRGEARDIDAERLHIARDVIIATRDADTVATRAIAEAEIAGEAAGDAKRAEADDWARRRP